MKPDKQRFGFVSGFIQTVVIGDAVTGLELRFLVFIHCRGFARGFFVDRDAFQRVARGFQLLALGHRECQRVGISPGVVPGGSREIERIAPVQLGLDLQRHIL